MELGLFRHQVGESWGAFLCFLDDPTLFMDQELPQQARET
jgi:hypothetical protein